MSDTKFTGYEITENGRVFSVAHNWRGHGRRELNQTPNAYGYPSVRLTIDGKRKRHPVHKLVALTFLPEKPSDKHQIRHLDGNKTNNKASNLKWGTAKENADDRTKHGRTQIGINHHNVKLTEDEVLEIREEAANGELQKNLAVVHGVTSENINMIVRRKSWRHI